MQQKRSYRRVVIFVAILLVVFAAAAAAYFFGGGLVRRTAADGMIAGRSEVHVMILGVDKRKDDVGRSDTLMVATVDPERGTAALLSIPRDTRVAIEGAGYDKINAAYAYGGYELTKNTLEQLLDVPMDYYILIDVHAFERIIDALDGIDIDVEKRMYYEDPWDDDGGLVIDIDPGMQHMTGEKAMQYVRYRDAEGDIGRIRRQQRFMRAVLQKVTAPEVFAKLPEIVGEVAKSVQTDLSVGDMIEFLQVMKKVQEEGLAAEMAPGRPAWYKGVSYWLPDVVELRRMAARAAGVPFAGDAADRAACYAAKYKDELPEGFRFDEAERKPSGKEAPPTDGEAAKVQEKPKDETKPPAPSEVAVTVINSSGITGAGAEVAAILQTKGFVIRSVETGKRSDREQTTIMAAGKSVDLFYGMPFPCILIEGGTKGEALVNIGRDYGNHG
ncbi:LCP family protein [Selenomonas sp.]|uniref:LCP family protein n=1 Tax=Selenomonas sp. TaxID=2053611 RepID=UPI003FA24C26